MNDCLRLCEAWPEATSGQQSCAQTLLQRSGFDVDGTPACVGVVTEKQCLGCSSVLETGLETCAEVYEICFVGPGLEAVSSKDMPKAGSARSEDDSKVQITVQGKSAEAGGESVSVGRDGIRIEGSGSGGGSVEIGKGGVAIREGGSTKAPAKASPAPPAPPVREQPASSQEQEVALVRCPTNEDCATGKNGQFRLECAGSNCNLFCGEGSDCAVACEANCDIEAAKGSHAEISCGANCDVICAPGATCVVDCPGGNCSCEGPGCRRAS